MDYMVEKDGKYFIVTMGKNETSDFRKRLLAYYKALILKTHDFDENGKKALNYIIDNMTDDEVKAIGDDLLKEKARFQNQMSSYQNKENKSCSEEEMKKAEALSEVINVIKDEDLDKRSRININGNIFEYEDGTVDIDKYKDQLWEIGEKSKGNAWFIYIDKDGELVIY